MAKAAIMIPDDDPHKEQLVTKHGYREGLLRKAHDNDDSQEVILEVVDVETGDVVTVETTSISSIAGANKKRLPEGSLEIIEDEFDVGSLDLDLGRVAEALLVDENKTSGLPFVYHNRYH